jgi:hypothetical protein
MDSSLPPNGFVNPLKHELDKMGKVAPPPRAASLSELLSALGIRGRPSDDFAPAEPPSSEIAAAIGKFPRIVTDALRAGEDGCYQTTLDAWLHILDPIFGRSVAFFLIEELVKRGDMELSSSSDGDGPIWLSISGAKVTEIWNIEVRSSEGEQNPKVAQINPELDRCAPPHGQISAKIEVSISPPQIIIDGIPVAVSEQQAIYVDAVKSAAGNWVSGNDIAKKHPVFDASKVNRAWKNLPPDVRKFIESKAGKGSRWTQVL